MAWPCAPGMLWGTLSDESLHGCLWVGKDSSMHTPTHPPGIWCLVLSSFLLLLMFTMLIGPLFLFVDV